MSYLFGIYGTGGCGRGIMPIMASKDGPPNSRYVFVDDNAVTKTCNGFRVLSLSEFMKVACKRRYIAVAIADPDARRNVAIRCVTEGLDFFEVRAQQVVQMDNVTIGEGALISPFVTFTSNIQIGSHFHANLYSYVEHDCIIGDYVTFAPGVRCNGHVHIGNGAYIGSGAIIKQGSGRKPLVIGQSAVVGMGAVVIKDVPAGATVVGNPARIMER